MNWIHKHVNSDFFTSYNEKYGNEGYWEWQQVMFQQKEFSESIKALVSNVPSPTNILDIGINNAYEFFVINSIPQCKWDWRLIEITGVDLSQSALKKAKWQLDDLGVSCNLINEDITEYKANNKSFDLCMAITSLQSAIIYDKNFRLFMDRLIGYMQNSSAFYIVAPNCAVHEGKVISGGAYNVRLKKQDSDFANNFISECAEILSYHNFKSLTMGSDFKTLISTRN